MNKRLTGTTRRASLVGICLSLAGIGLLAIPALQTSSAGAATLRHMGHGWCYGSTTQPGNFGAMGGQCSTTTTGDTPKTTCTTVPPSTTTEATTTTTESTTTTSQPTSPTETTASTTTTESTTTTSLAVQGSTTLVTEATTTTGPESSTSGTVGGQGGTVAPPTTSATVAGAATLPRTGLDWAFPVLFGLSALVGGGMLVRRRRTFWSRDKTHGFG
jgi:LPXTG-motif cell wall-anchored protein